MKVKRVVSEVRVTHNNVQQEIKSFQILMLDEFYNIDSYCGSP